MNLNSNNWCLLPTEYGVFRMYDTNNEDIRVISVTPIEEIKNNTLLRIHSSCIASEVFGAKDCDCSDQLHEAMQLIASEGNGLIIHLQQEGRGHGLSRKIKAVSVMQKEGCDTVESFTRLGYQQDIRDFTEVFNILKLLNITSVRLISNNPYKINALQKNGFEVQAVNTHPKIRQENRDYLYSKNAKLGHCLPLKPDKHSDTIMFYHSTEEWGEFSNFSNHAIFLDGKIWPTVEHFYQSQKLNDEEDKETIRLCASPSLAKQMAKTLLQNHSTKNWHTQKEDVMYKGLVAKFTQHPNLMKTILSTKHKTLVERSDTDNYWGDGLERNGKNRLGYLLMRLRRQELKKQLADNFQQLATRILHLTNLKELGRGGEGVVFTNYHSVYKFFYDITDIEWGFLKEKSYCFSRSTMLTEMRFFEINNLRFIQYPYIKSQPLKIADKEQLISFLKFCSNNQFIFGNIKPLNFIQTAHGMKLIDYGRSFTTYTDNKLKNATKRAYLLWKYPTMPDSTFKLLTQKINNDEEFNEISGWEDFWNEVTY